MTDIRKFGDKDHPIRCSSVPYLIKCGARLAISFIEPQDRTSNEYSDTGTAAHLGVSLWHKGSGAQAAISEMKSRLSEFPQADIEKATFLVSSYTNDPRNEASVVVQSEMFMQFTLPPFVGDPTGEPIYFEGTCDQVRTSPLGLILLDYKTGADDGVTMLAEFSPQLSIYAHGAAETLKQPVGVGGIIRGRGYADCRKKTWVAKSDDPSPPGVFFEACMGRDAVDALLFRVRHTVAAIRSGFGLYGPGSFCSHCPHGGLAACVPTGRGLGLLTC